MVGSCLGAVPWYRLPGFKHANAGRAGMAPKTAWAYFRSRPGALCRNRKVGLSATPSIQTECSYATNDWELPLTSVQPELAQAPRGAPSQATCSSSSSMT